MFNLRLKNLREDKGISQYALAAELHMSQSTIGNWEAGSRLPDPKTMSLLADYFDVSVDYLLGRTDTRKETSAAIGEEDIKAALFGKGEEVTDEMWEEVVNFANYVKSKHKEKKEK